MLLRVVDMVATGWVDCDQLPPAWVILGVRDAVVGLCDGLELHKRKLLVSYKQRVFDFPKLLAESEDVLFLHSEADTLY